MATTPKWQAGTLYLPGALVQPLSSAPPASTAITNPGFETGDDTDWTLGTNTTVSSFSAFTGTYGIQFTGSAGVTETIHDAVGVGPGTAITASCMYRRGAAGNGQNVAAVQLYWYTAAMALIRQDGGSLVNSGGSGSWQQSTVSATAPASAAFVAIGVYVNRTDTDPSWADTFTWNYTAATAPVGLIYKAVQAASGLSGDTEPVWPLTVGLTVVDNQVTWEAVIMSRVVWQASPILRSGATEPVWPEVLGGYVPDGTIKWRTVTRRVEDENCPNTKVVAIIASKVFAVDKDIVRFSATANPLDWTSADNAGYLATGLQQANANDMAVLAPYRSNLVPMNASSLQNWQVDPDPALMAILDQMEGIGSTWHKAAQPVADELLYLSQLGVRSVGVAAGANSLASGDVGMPIDALVQAEILDAVQNERTPIATYYPSQGQFWLAFPKPLAATCGVPQVYSGGLSFPNVTSVQLGAGLGIVTLTLETGEVPDKFEVWIGGVKVLDTGYIGDPDYQDELDAYLALRGLPPETIVPFPGIGIPVVVPFEKTTTNAFATVKVYAPIPGTGWNFTLSCPDGGPPPTVVDPTTDVYVFTMNSKPGKWSRYLFPFSIDSFAQLGNDLYIRNGDQVSLISEDAVADDTVVDDEVVPVEFGGIVWWPWLDFGQPGVTKMLQGIDVVASGTPSISIGYDQRNLAMFTAPYEIPADTLPGGMIPFPVSAPTLSVRVDFAAGEKWGLLAVNLFLADHRLGM